MTAIIPIATTSVNASIVLDIYTLLVASVQIVKLFNAKVVPLIFIPVMFEDTPDNHLITGTDARPKRMVKNDIMIVTDVITGLGSLALRAASLRGIARKVIPNAFTKHAAANPLVSASTAAVTLKNIL